MHIQFAQFSVFYRPLIARMPGGVAAAEIAAAPGALDPAVHPTAVLS